MARFGDTKALVVTRFDRRWIGIPEGAERKARFRPPSGGWIARLPQEDLCQALGIGPDRKYQSDGGPSMQDCLAVLSSSEHAQEDQADFVLTQFAFWLLAATDGHAKNFSIQHRRGGGFGMTPLYDVLSAWPMIGNGPNHLSYPRATLAMGVKAGHMHYRLRDIQARHWQGLAAAVTQDVWPRLIALARNVDAALAEVEAELPDGFPSLVWTSTSAGMKRHVQSFLQAPRASL